jgi:hypothetical protein
MIDLDRWWRRLRPMLSSTKETVTVDRDELERQLAAVLPYDLGARFGLPPLATAYFDRLGAHDWCAEGISRYLFLFGAASAVGQLRRSVETFQEITQFKDVEAGFCAAGAWITLGEKDKHTLLLCCDRTRDDFGQVVDAFDAHPWYNDTGIDIYSRGDLACWMDSLALQALPDCVLVALTPLELTQLEGMREDPARLFAAAQALEDEPYPRADRCEDGASWVAYAKILRDEDHRRLALIDARLARQLIASYSVGDRTGSFLREAADAGNTVLAHCRARPTVSAD